MPAPLGRGTCSPRRIIDPYASHYFAVPPACFAFLVWRFCLRVFAGAFFLLLLPPLSLVAMSRLPSSPPLDSSLILGSPNTCGKRSQPIPVPRMRHDRVLERCDEQRPARATDAPWPPASPPERQVHGRDVPASVPEAAMDWCQWECELTEDLHGSHAGLPPHDSGERALTTVRLRGP